MSDAYGIKAILPVDAPHILGMASARTGASDLLLDIWNGSTSAARVLAVQKDGRLWLPDGAAATPAVGFWNDPDTGLFSKAANQLGFAVGGAEAAYLGATGLSWGGGSVINSSSGLALAGHTHVESDITDLGNYLTVAAAAATYATLGHNHDSVYAKLTGGLFTGTTKVTHGTDAQIWLDNTGLGNQYRLRANAGSLSIDFADTADFGTYTARVIVTAAGVVQIQGDENHLGGSGQKVSFFGAGAGTVKQTVSGSRGGNAALASLLTALAGYGLITDSSS